MGSSTSDIQNESMKFTEDPDLNSEIPISSGNADMTFSDSWRGERCSDGGLVSRQQEAPIRGIC